MRNRTQRSQSGEPGPHLGATRRHARRFSPLVRHVRPRPRRHLRGPRRNREVRGDGHERRAVRNHCREVGDRPASYELVLRAKQFSHQFTPSAAATAASLYQQAIDLDGRNANAWAGLARVFSVQAGYGFSDAREFQGRAKEAARRALHLDASLPEVQEVNGVIALAFEHELEDAGTFLRKAHSLAPHDSRMVSSLSMYECMFGRFDAGIPLATGRWPRRSQRRREVIAKPDSRSSFGCEAIEPMRIARSNDSGRTEKNGVSKSRASTRCAASATSRSSG